MRSLFLFFSLITALPFFLTSCVSTTGSKKPIPPQYRNISIDSKWNDSPVVILDHTSDISFIHDPQGNRVETKETKWILVKNKNRNGMEKIAIYWNKSFEEPPRIEAEAYYPDSTHWTLPTGEIESDKDPFSNSVREDFLIPGYQKGVVIKLLVEREFLQPEFYGFFPLANSFPTLKKEIRLQYPSDIELNFGLENQQKLVVESNQSEEAGQSIATYSAKDIDKRKKKYDTPYPESYYSALHVSFPPMGKKSYTWEELGNHYLDLTKQAFEPTDEIKEMISSIESGDSVKKDSFDAVVKRLRYHGDWNGRYSFYPREAKVIFKNGYGDCKELSTLLKTLLESYSVPTHFVLLSTWYNRQPLEKYPNLANFNHAILTAREKQGGYHFMDATHNWASSDNSFFASIGRKALILKEGASHISEIKPSKRFKNRVLTDTDIRWEKKKGVWMINGSVELSGYPGLKFYENYKANSDIYQPETYAILFLDKKFGINADKASIRSMDSSRVVLDYSAPFQNNYLSLDNGGFRLSQPGLYKTVVNDSHTDLEGADYRYSFTQEDCWHLPFLPSSQKTWSFSSDFAKGQWSSNGKDIVRKYSQRSKHFKAGTIQLESWYKKTKKFTQSYVWK